MPQSLFAKVEAAPRDPILGLTEAFNADTRKTKVNLGVGVYTDGEGRVPVMAAVRQAEQQRAERATPRSYLPIDGLAAYDEAVRTMLFGADAEVMTAGRAVTAQALGGTGALKIGADLLHRLQPDAAVLISDPSWENHRALFEAAGMKVSTYPYYDAASHGLNFAGMLSALRAAAPGTVIVLHTCCHNPTGVDMSAEQWDQVVEVCEKGGLVPFLDLAYQGFAEGIEADAYPVRRFAKSGCQFLISSSFSKSFSMYGERVGALTVVAASKEEAARVLSQLKRVIRTNYSSPPTHGAAVVATILADPRLRALWEGELGQMRERIREMRAALVEGLKKRGVPGDYSFVMRQRGMFSYSGLSAAQVDRLREDHGIYAVSTGRICVAALNRGNVDAVCDAIAAVSKR